MIEEKQKRIIWVNDRLGNSFEDRIEINKELYEKYPEIYNHVLNHELSHTNKFFTIKDLKEDFKLNKYSFKLFFFILKRPHLWKEFLPIQRRNKIIEFDMNMIILYGIIIGLIILNIIIFSRIF